jgi:enoyl-CoA hydratase/carnithine racemase
MTKPTAQVIPTASADEPIVVRTDADGVSVLTLNRPQARNALTEAMLHALSSTFAAIAGDSSVRAIVLTANGPVFCAGHDLKELTGRRSDPDGGEAFFEHVWDDCGALMQAIVRLPQPVIAAVQGPATAAGCELVACCDLAVASSLATFCTPGVDIGLFCSTPAVPISRNVARKHAMEMLLIGDMISAEDARRFGLINWVVEPHALHTQAMTIAHKIASKSAVTMRIGKKAFYQQIDLELTDAYRHAARVMVDNMFRHDANEGIRAFLEKRPARWEDR